MKIHLLIPLILLLFAGTIKIEQSEYGIYTEENLFNTCIENSLDIENPPNSRVPVQDNNMGYYLIMDHLFVYTNPMVNYKISVEGRIPVQYEENFAVYVKLNNKEYLTSVSTLAGSGKVKVSGRGSMNAGSFKVKKINYDSEININIQGKTRFLELESGDAIPLKNLALKEEWDADLNWDIETSDPENDDLRYEMFRKIVPTKIPDSPHTGRTLEYTESFLYEDQTYEHVSSIPGMGTFRWRYTISYTYAKGEWGEINPELTVNPKNQNRYDKNRPLPKDYIKTHEPKLGPPLESIVWEVVDENTAPLIR
jgi:hypothetical protein